MEIKKVLVTGSEGYIGAVLIRKLIKQGYNVIGIDALYFGNIGIGFQSKHYKLINADIRNIGKISFRGVDAIIHLAALSNDPLGELNPEITKDINLYASVDLAKAAKKAGVKRFIFSSSCTIYGINDKEFVDERSNIDTLTSYARTKRQAEKELLKICDKNFCVTILRNSTVYGFSPRFRNDLVVNHFLTCGIARKQIKVLSDGTPWRPQIDVRDASTIFIAFLQASKDKINGQIFNVGFKENNFQVNDILHEVKKHLPNCEVVYTGEHGRGTRTYRVNFAKFRRAFPRIKQKWTLSKSIKDLLTQLRRIKYGKVDFDSGKYMRANTIKNLLEKRVLDNKLYWRKR